MAQVLALPKGALLVGDYQIDRVLGAGGFGITYLGRDLSLARAIAIKEYFPADSALREGGCDVDFRSEGQQSEFNVGLERFIEEAQALAQFDHHNIARVYRYFRANNTAYMVLHYEEGLSFKAWCQRLDRLPTQAELDAIISPLLDALETLHAANFLHRDIAPDNIIIRPDGSPVLIDFGSARREVAARSQTLSAVIKPGYSPVEQYSAQTSQQGPWTDIYALGARQT
ncbi:MAG: serine/threonine-protein kinase [Pseudomonadota bacterium]